MENNEERTVHEAEVMGGHTDEPRRPGGKHGGTWGMLCHLSALAGFVGVPFGHILGPLVVWLVKKDEYAFVDDQGKEALNFQISILIYTVVSAFLILMCLGIVLLVLVQLFNFVMIIVASIKASNGEKFRYPLTLRLIK
jgi:uncharacterized Tic20 family protein